jgi:Tol biopolymer transport system component
MSVPFDARRLVATGTPARVLDNVLESADGAAQVSVSGSGAVVYVPAAADVHSRRLLAVDRSGKVTPYAAPPRPYAAPRVSPDGRSIAVTVTAPTEDLWVYDIGRGALSQITYEAGVRTSVWTPDGARLTYESNKGGPANLFWRTLSGGADERLASNEHIQLPGSWSPDGRVLAFVQRDPTTGRDLWLLPLDGDRKPRPFLNSAFDESAPRFSPDGRWIAYVSNESGTNEVYTAPVAQPAKTQQVSSGGGAEPVWARTGRELYYRAGNRMMAAAIGDGGKAGGPRILFEEAFEPGTLDSPNYDVSADGQSFIMVEAAARDAARQELHVLLNWLR